MDAQRPDVRASLAAHPDDAWRDTAGSTFILHSHACAVLPEDTPCIRQIWKRCALVQLSVKRTRHMVLFAVAGTQVELGTWTTDPNPSPKACLHSPMFFSLSYSNNLLS